MAACVERHNSSSSALGRKDAPRLSSAAISVTAYRSRNAHPVEKVRHRVAAAALHGLELPMRRALRNGESSSAELHVPGTVKRSSTAGQSKGRVVASDRTSCSRRRFIGNVGSAIGVLTLGEAVSSVVYAADLPHVTSSDPTAVALHYTEDASGIDPAKYPTHLAGARCANCNLYQGSASAAYGPCQLYPGKAVSSKGWCMGYQKKAG